ncbi:MAG TPA: VOC family protein [Acidimicrobiia bacterium]|nr:VOC family protein [Acidimicrobiia bacterium]
MIGELFHTGVVVEDVERAIDDLSRALGLRFTAVQEHPMRQWRPSGEQRLVLRYAYSLAPYPLVELIEAQPGTFYERVPGSAMQLHHVGLWVDDLATAAERIAREGFDLAAAGVDDDGNQPARVTFHESAHGLRVELCDVAMRAGFDAWVTSG